MPPAARLGDQTAHGTPLGGGGIGSPNVLIGGKPAWRIGVDVHVCPLFDGPKPHVGGVTMVGCPTVLINNFPAAKLGDLITEASAPNSIVMGDQTVLICG
jgi:uncharacterized Zn-binding protein involved in type VI secretion